jgi:hypothetical protein
MAQPQIVAVLLHRSAASELSLQGDSQGKAGDVVVDWPR